MALRTVCDEIVSGLFLCDLQAIASEAVNKKVDAYISVCKSSPDSYRIFLRHIAPEKIHLVNSLSKEMLLTVNMLDRELRSGRSIAIFDETGHQRAASLIVAYLIRHGRMPYSSAIGAVMSKSTAVFPQPRVYETVLRQLTKTSSTKTVSDHVSVAKKANKQDLSPVHISHLVFNQ